MPVCLPSRTTRPLHAPTPRLRPGASMVLGTPPVSLVVTASVVASVNLDHPGVAEVDATRMARVDHKRSSAGLDPGPPQRLARVDRAPGGGVVMTCEETAPAQPDEERAVRVLSDAVHAGAGEAGARGREGLPPVERADHLPEPLSSVNHLRIAAIDGDCAKCPRLA